MGRCECATPRETYNTRFGDVCCTGCHAALAWDANLVNPGVYGDRTPAWIAAQTKRFGRQPRDTEPMAVTA